MHRLDAKVYMWRWKFGAQNAPQLDIRAAREGMVAFIKPLMSAICSRRASTTPVLPSQDKSLACPIAAKMRSLWSALVLLPSLLPEVGAQGELWKSKVKVYVSVLNAPF